MATKKGHVCNDKCGTIPHQPHWYPDWEAADAAWRRRPSDEGAPDEDEQAKRMAWKGAYVQGFNDRNVLYSDHADNCEKCGGCDEQDRLNQEIPG